MRFETFEVAPETLVLGLAAAGIVLLCLIAWLVWKSGRRRTVEAAAARATAHDVETELAELKGRLAGLAELSVTRTAEMSRSLNERLDRVSHHIGRNMEDQTRATTHNLSALAERLAVIDTAQKNITELSARVVSLQDVLANKQARGAFGQMRMEAIIQDGLPSEAYSFQPTLSNGRRPDCLVRLPGVAAGIVVDAKFPLEGFEALRLAHAAEDRKAAQRRVRIDIGKHIDDMAARYALPGETADTLLLFVPSESIYAELHEDFADVLQKAHRARVVIVSPNMLMLAVQTMQAILKDVRMREQAGLIQREVSMLVADVTRLTERALDLQRHFGLVGQDVEKLLVSSERIGKRGRRLETLDFEDRKGVAQEAHAIKLGA